ncbi:sugar ABC transporter ATP-binding protein [Catenuloplanes japonicus]|uniref:sugar ABC transporter ATP-binding protein n=1 Tax=Catenuloplanes japonicus TaxID=33876 RepID=UPI00052777E7|nr:sugar ABC transporter ATP-binding protein [Catenuloplanes japonicus]
MTVPALRMRGIVKTFPGTRACDGADLEVLPGEVHCLLGENGAGKSTLMKILSGSQQPDSGEIEIGGQVVRLHNPHDGMRAGISVIYQELDLVPDMTVAQNLYLGYTPARGPIVRHGLRNRMAREAIARVGGTFAPTALVRDLPVADQQLTAIARSLTADARIIVMDEPSATLTAHDLEAVFTLIRRLAAEGRAIIYISHRLDEVKRVGDRATVLRDGRTVARFDLANTDAEQLITAMIGDTARAEHRPRRAAATSTPLLEVRRVSVPGLLDIQNLAVRRGEIVGLGGLGGAGRTTLLSALFGGTHAQVDASLGGAPLRAGNPGRAVKAGIGLVPEDRKGQGLFREMSVHRNGGMAALKTLGLAPGRTAGRLALGPLRELGVKYAGGDQLVGQLSGGNQQKVVLAKWMARGVRLLLLDEPTRGLDIGAKADLFQQVRRLADEGVGVLFASSELSELTTHADLVWVLYEGRNIASFDPLTTPEDTIARTIVTGSHTS